MSPVLRLSAIQRTVRNLRPTPPLKSIEEKKDEFFHNAPLLEEIVQYGIAKKTIELQNAGFVIFTKSEEDFTQAVPFS